jgi:isopenicillin-N N-acyltransferase-like protein
VTSPRLRRFALRFGIALAVSILLLRLGDLALDRACRIAPPHVEVHPLALTQPSPGLRVFGRSFVLERDGLFEAHLTGSPEEIGFAHSRLFYPEMVENEGVLLANFRKAVPSSPLRALLLDLAELRYRHVADQMSDERRLEIAAGALGFQPDPYAELFPTFQRFAYLNALYDIALSFEHSPLIGCTTFVFSGAATTSGGGLLARNFDFEVDPIFDRKKAVFFVRPSGRIPFASVAWPGLVGVVSGMNLEGVAVVVHGARAGQPQTSGEPVVHALRAVLSQAHSTKEAVALLATLPALVSHIVVVTDAGGNSVRIERMPGTPDHVIALAEAAAVTNHFAGPAANDPKNLAVRAHTSTLARRARGDELVKSVPRPVTASAAVSLLRDRKAAGGRMLELGDRDAIDALIATHGVVLDTQARRLWVSVAPHLLGRFVAFDLARLLAPNYAPEPDLELATIPADSSVPSRSAATPGR